jgi:hypothetical protein
VGGNLTPGARARQPRTDGPLPPSSPRRHAQIAPPRSTGAGAAAPRPRRRSRAAPRPARGRCPPRRPPKAAKTGQNGPRNGSDRCPRETPGRPPARSEAPARGQLGPLSTMGVRLASWHRASSARGFYLLTGCNARIIITGCKPGRTSLLDIILLRQVYLTGRPFRGHYGPGIFYSTHAARAHASAAKQQLACKMLIMFPTVAAAVLLPCKI